ncbi:Conserved_hypothetical protein [Hexamita inflata]|uniref:Uncharacterized protein n=1 Tax=Hexamita inflata TaxID=28002 RepID=A0AA86TBP7_9EUKA|nr:Conserved hypothetical protein [Hexamita inflata]
MSGLNYKATEFSGNIQTEMDLKQNIDGSKLLNLSGIDQKIAECAFTKYMSAVSASCPNMEYYDRIFSNLSNIKLQTSDLLSGPELKLLTTYLQNSGPHNQVLAKEAASCQNDPVKSKAFLNQFQSDLKDIKSYLKKLNPVQIEHILSMNDKNIDQDVVVHIETSLEKAKIIYPGQTEGVMSQTIISTINNEKTPVLSFETLESLLKYDQVLKNVGQAITEAKVSILKEIKINHPKYFSLSTQFGPRDYDYALTLIILQFGMASSAYLQLLSADKKNLSFEEKNNAMNYMKEYKVVLDDSIRLQAAQQLSFVDLIFKSLGITCSDRIEDSYELVRFDRLCDLDERPYENYKIAEKTILKKVDLDKRTLYQNQKHSNSLEQQICKQLGSQLFQYDGDTKGLGEKNQQLMYIPYEFMDIANYFMKTNNVTTGVQDFAIKVTKAIQYTIFSTLVQQNFFKDNLITESFNLIFGKEQDITSSMQMICDVLHNQAKNTNLLQNILQPQVFQMLLFDPQLADFVILRVILQIYFFFMEYSPDTKFSEEQQKKNIHIRPHILLFNNLGCIITELYYRLAGTFKYPYHIPIRFIPEQLIKPQNIVDFNGIKLYIDQSPSIIGKQYAMKLDTMLNFNFHNCSTTNHPEFFRLPSYCEKMDNVLGEYSDFAVYKVLDRTQIVLIYPNHQIFTVVNTKQNPLTRQFAPERKVTISHFFKDSNIFYNEAMIEAWISGIDYEIKQKGLCQARKILFKLDLLSEMQKGVDKISQLTQEYNLLVLNSKKMNSLEKLQQKHDLPANLQLQELIDKIYAIIISKRVINSMKACYLVNTDIPFNLGKLVEQKQLKFITEFFSYQKKLEGYKKIELVYDKILPLYYQTAVNFIKTLFKHDLLELYYDTIHYQKCLSDTFEQEQNGLCELVHSALAVQDLTDENLGPIMHQFSQKILKLQQTSSQKSINFTTTSIEQYSEVFASIFNCFENSWAGIDFNLLVTSLIAYISRLNNSYGFNIAQEMEQIHQQVETLFSEIDFNSFDCPQVKSKLKDKHEVIRLVQQFFKMTGIKDISILERATLKTQESIVPSIVCDQYKKFKTAGSRLVKTIKSGVNILSLASTVNTNFYMKKRTFYFQVPSGQMDLHSFKNASQNKILTQQLTQIKQTYVDQIFKYDFIKLFVNINSAYDGSAKMKQFANWGLLIVAKVLEPFVQKTAFMKQLGLLVQLSTTTLQEITQNEFKELTSLINPQQINNFIRQYLVFHQDFISNAFSNNNESAIKQYFYDQKKVQTSITRNQKLFGELFSATSTHESPLQLDTEVLALNQLSTLLKDAVNAKMGDIANFDIYDFDLKYNFDELNLFQQKLNVPLQAYTPVEKKVQVPEIQQPVQQVQPIQQVEQKQVIGAEQVIEEEAKLILEQQQQKEQQKKDKKDKKKKQKEKEKKKNAKPKTQKQQEDLQDDEDEEQQEVEQETINQAIPQQTQQTQGFRNNLHVEEQISQPRAQELKPESVSNITPLQAVQEPVIEAVSEQQDAPPGLESEPEGEYKYATQLLQKKITFTTKLMNLNPSKLEGMSKIIAQFTNTLQHLVSQAQGKDEQFKAKFRSIFPMNPHEFLAALFTKPSSTCILFFENITTQLGQNCLKIFQNFQELYLLVLGQIIFKLDLSALKMVNIKFETQIFNQKLQAVKKTLNSTEKQTLEILLKQLDLQNLYVPFMAGLAADFSICPVYHSSGCNYQGTCYHSYSAWYIMEQIYEQFAPQAQLPNSQFRAAFENTLQCFPLQCPTCGLVGFTKLQKRQIIAHGAADQAVEEKLKQLIQEADENEPSRFIVLEIGGEGYLSGVQSCCWTNQYIDEFI